MAYLSAVATYSSIAHLLVNGSDSQNPKHMGNFEKLLSSITLDNRTKKRLSLRNSLISAMWKLDYHAPAPLERDGHRGLIYRLEISDQSGSQEVDFDVYNWKLGWNAVGQFNLNAGEVRVGLLGTSQRGPLWADAIRWSKVEKD